jgi:cell division transport system permease protein
MLQRRRDLPLAGDPASRFVPGIIGIMVFLSVLVLATTLVLGNAIERWRLSYSVQMTVEVPPSAVEHGVLEHVIAVLTATPGVTAAEPLSDDRVAELLSPWIGGNIDIDQLPLPVLVDLRLEAPGAVDTVALQEVLDREAPGARIDDGRRWLDPVRETARALQMIAALMLVFIAAGAVATVVFMTRTGLAVHHDTIAILHQVGAQDRYIARQFQTQALGLALYGGVPGLIVGLLCIVLVGSLAGELEAPLLPEFALGTHGWVALLAVPVAAALIAMVTARLTVMTTLARLP